MEEFNKLNLDVSDILNLTNICLLNEEQKRNLYLLYFTCNYEIDTKGINEFENLNKEIVVLQRFIQQRIIFETAKNELLFRFLNKINPLLKPHKNVEELNMQTGGMKMNDIILPLFTIGTLINGIEVSISKDIQTKGVVYPLSKQFDAVQGGLFSNFLSLNNDKDIFIKGIDLINKEINIVEERYNEACENAFESFPKDKLYSFTFEGLTENTLLLKSDEFKEKVNNELIQNILDKKPILDSDGSEIRTGTAVGKVIGYSIGELAAQATGLLYGFTNAISESNITDDNYIENTAVIKPEKTNKIVSNEIMNELEKMEVSNDEITNIINSVKKEIIQPTITIIEQVKQNNIMMKLTEEVCRYNVPKPFIRLEGNDLYIDNLSYGDDYASYQIMLLLANIENIIGGKNNLENYPMLKSSHEKLQIMSKLLIASNRFYDKRIFSPSDNILQSLVKLQKVSKNYSFLSLKLLEQFPLTNELQNFEYQQRISDVKKRSTELQLSKAESYMTTDELTAYIDSYADIFGATAGQGLKRTATGLADVSKHITDEGLNIFGNIGNKSIEIIEGWIFKGSIPIFLACSLIMLITAVSTGSYILLAYRNRTGKLILDIVESKTSSPSNLPSVQNEPPPLLEITGDVIAKRITRSSNKSKINGGLKKSKRKNKILKTLKKSKNNRKGFSCKKK